MKLLAILCVVAVVSAHNWVESPVSRNGNTDSRTAPCPTTTPLPEPRPTVFRGDSYTVVWTDNHAGVHNLNLLNSDLTPAGSSASFPNPSTTGSVTIPADAPLGHMVVQYEWEGYYNCMDINVMTTIQGAVPCDESQSCGANVVSTASRTGTFDQSTGVLTCNEGCEANEAGDDCECGGGIAGAAGGINGFAVALFVLGIIGAVSVAVGLAVNNRREKSMGGMKPVDQEAPAAAVATTAARAAPPAPKASSSPTFSPGTSVQALYREENQYYPAKVISKRPNGYVVQFEGYPEHVTVSSNEIRA